MSGYLSQIWKKTIQMLAAKAVVVLGCISAHSMGDFYTCEGITDAETYSILGSYRDTCCHQGNIFSPEISGYFSRTIPGLILHVLPRSDFADRVCDSPA